MKVTLELPWLILSFSELQQALSWAVHGGGFQIVRHVAWHQVRNQDLTPDVEPSLFLFEKLKIKGLTNAAAMLTSADISSYQDVTKENNGLTARSIATVGMRNALRVGDPPAWQNPLGTINLLCAVSSPLSQPALAEALSIAAEARTAAVLEAGIASPQTGLPATGTGTDCIVIACPVSQVQGFRYAGKHTEIGSLIGTAVYEAVSSGLNLWKKTHSVREVLV